ncbi:MAG: DUF3000 domain-containing protein [Austwickia sp.]|nr:DUF3000 domain-containing protein [Austwickia sp.]MBK9100918.1 DUF3000 domain-containing protein [Austwickia sp.]
MNQTGGRVCGCPVAACTSRLSRGCAGWAGVGSADVTGASCHGVRRGALAWTDPRPYSAEVTSRGVRAGHAPGFDRAVAGLINVERRPEVTLSEIPAPQRVAPFAVALSADVEASYPLTSSLQGQAADEPADDDEPLAAGRFVVLHDPGAPSAWDGTWRVVTFARARLEPELAADPMLGSVGWSWLMDALTDAGVVHDALGGTVTRVVSDGFGTMDDQGTSVDLEVRASWTPTGDDLPAQLSTWLEVLCTLAGLPPLPEGVRPLRTHRG